MRSMTGFGCGTARDDRLEVVCELQSVNRKALEVSFILPREWAAFEHGAHERVRQRLERGKIQGAIKVQPLAGSGLSGVDRPAVTEVFNDLRAVAADLDVPWQPDADLVARIALAKSAASSLPSDDVVAGLLHTAVDGAVDQLIAMRGAEGLRLGEDLSARLDALQAIRAEIEALTTDAATDYRQALMTRLQKAGLELELDDERVLREIALFADKADVAEEITRLGAHLAQFHEFVAMDGAVGRRMDFLCQELNREINTVGSKSTSVDVTRRVIEFKNELERIREQIQNVE